jgi:hypothetical protein
MNSSHGKATSSAPTMIDYSRVAKGDVLEIVGSGAPGHAAVGDRVRVVHLIRVARSRR